MPPGAGTVTQFCPLLPKDLSKLLKIDLQGVSVIVHVIAAQQTTA